MQTVSDSLKKARVKSLWRIMAHSVALCLLVGCEPPGREAQCQHYLFSLGHTRPVDVPTMQLPVLHGPPGIDQLHLDIPAGNLDSVDFLALSGCAVQVTIGKRQSNLGRMARDAQRLLLTLEYLRLAPRCITYQRQRDAVPLADTLERAWQVQRQQLPALIFNATLGGAEYRALWHAPVPAYTPGESNSATSSSRVIPALQAINVHARRWLSGDYRAENRAFEILLSEVAAGDGSALLQALASQDAWLARRYRAVLPPVTALEELLSSVLPPDYRDWERQRSARLEQLLAAPGRHAQQLKAIQQPCIDAQETVRE